MDFAVDKTQKEFKKAALEFGKGEFDKEMSLEMEAKQEFPKKIFEKAGELGFIGMHFPEKFSGQDLGLLETAMVTEEFCRMDSTIGCALTLSSYGSEIILKEGTDAQKEKYLPEVAEGRMISAYAALEEGRGSEIEIIGTIAEKSGDSYVINGAKKFVMNAGIANFYIVLVKTDKDADKGKGLSMILVDADTAGVSVESQGEKLGLQMTPTGTVTFKDVKVSAENLVGKEGDGLKIAEDFKVVSQVLFSAMATGIGQGAMEKAIQYGKDRVQFHTPIAKFQLIQYKIADMAIQAAQSRALTYQAAWDYDKNKKKLDPTISAIAKSVASTSAVEIAAQAIQIYGGYGYMKEYEVESYYRDAKITQLVQGSRSDLKKAISKVVVGKLK